MFGPVGSSENRLKEISLKTESIRQRVPLSLEDARRIVGEYIGEYNENRLHSAIGYVTPLTKLEGKEEDVWRDRERKLFQAREKRARMRQKERMGEKPKIGLTEKMSFSVSR